MLRVSHRVQRAAPRRLERAAGSGSTFKVASFSCFDGELDEKASN